MNIFKYIRGSRKGKEINRLEREAMEDPFLADALEGYDKIHGDHEARIKRIQDKISAQTRSSNNVFRYWAVAASILLIIGMGGGYFLWNEFNQSKKMLVAESSSILLDKAGSENLEEKKAPDSSKMDYAPKIYAEMDDKQPVKKKEAEFDNLTSDLQQEKGVDIKDLTEHKVIVEAPKTSAAPSEGMAFRADTVSTPQPVIGVKAYNEYLKTNLIRPTDEECKNATGVVTLSFPIDKNGHPYNIRIIQSLCPLADWEAMRLVKEGPIWTISDSIAIVNVYF